MNYRHHKIADISFLFSQKNEEINEEYYDISYKFVKTILVKCAKLSMKFNSVKYHFVDMPYLYRERQLDSVLLPVLSEMCNGIVMAEYPVNRNSKSRYYQVENSSGRVDYWCVYHDYSFIIEVKHSYDNFKTDVTYEKELISEWEWMNLSQLDNIKLDVKDFIETTKGIIRIALHFVASYNRETPSELLIEEYRKNERKIMDRLVEDVSKKYSKIVPDFIGCWEIDQSIINSYEDTNPGLILMSKFYKPIYHKGSNITT